MSAARLNAQPLGKRPSRPERGEGDAHRVLRVRPSLGLL